MFKIPSKTKLGPSAQRIIDLLRSKPTEWGNIADHNSHHDAVLSGPCGIKLSIYCSWAGCLSNVSVDEDKLDLTESEQDAITAAYRSWSDWEAAPRRAAARAEHAATQARIANRLGTCR